MAINSSLWREGTFSSLFSLPASPLLRRDVTLNPGDDPRDCVRAEVAPGVDSRDLNRLRGFIAPPMHPNILLIGDWRGVTLLILSRTLSSIGDTGGSSIENVGVAGGDMSPSCNIPPPPPPLIVNKAPPPSIRPDDTRPTFWCWLFSILAWQFLFEYAWLFNSSRSLPSHPPPPQPPPDILVVVLFAWCVDVCILYGILFNSINFISSCTHHIIDGVCAVIL